MKNEAAATTGTGTKAPRELTPAEYRAGYLAALSAEERDMMARLAGSVEYRTAGTFARRTRGGR